MGTLPHRLVPDQVHAWPIAAVLGLALTLLTPTLGYSGPDLTESEAQSERDAATPLPQTPHVVFVIGEELYETRTTLPRFAREVLEPSGYETTVVRADPKGGHEFPGIEEVEEADLLVLSVRRRALPEDQLDRIRNHLASGKPLVAIRTSSHAFNIHGETPPAGHAVWPEFDREVLGAQYRGHYDHEGGTGVQIAPDAVDHPIVSGIDIEQFRSGGELYQSRDLGPATRLLLTGHAEADGESVSEPVAWTHDYQGARVFYTSLGHPSDFDHAPFRTLLLRAVAWGLEREIPSRGE